MGGSSSTATTITTSITTTSFSSAVRHGSQIIQNLHGVHIRGLELSVQAVVTGRLDAGYKGTLRVDYTHDIADGPCFRRSYRIHGGPFESVALEGNFWDLCMDSTQGNRLVLRTRGHMLSLRDRHEVEEFDDSPATMLFAITAWWHCWRIGETSEKKTIEPPRAAGHRRPRCRPGPERCPGLRR